jgi:hypothetical protein
MKQAFITGRGLRAFPDRASFTAKRLILVEYVQKNGSNKEIRRLDKVEAPRKQLVKS